MALDFGLGWFKPRGEGSNHLSKVGCQEKGRSCDGRAHLNVGEAGGGFTPVSLQTLFGNETGFTSQRSDIY